MHLSWWPHHSTDHTKKPTIRWEYRTVARNLQLREGWNRYQTCAPINWIDGIRSKKLDHRGIPAHRSTGNRSAEDGRHPWQVYIAESGRLDDSRGNHEESFWWRNQTWSLPYWRRPIAPANRSQCCPWVQLANQGCSEHLPWLHHRARKQSVWDSRCWGDQSHPQAQEHECSSPTSAHYSHGLARLKEGAVRSSNRRKVPSRIRLGPATYKRGHAPQRR